MITPQYWFSSSNTPVNFKAEAHGTGVSFIHVDMALGQRVRLHTYR
jgi:hypothetical protein